MALQTNGDGRGTEERCRRPARLSRRLPLWAEMSWNKATPCFSGGPVQLGR